MISESASLNILSESKTSLAGRELYYELKPLSFREFLELKNIHVGAYLVYKDILEKEFDKFLIRQFP